MPDSQRSAGRTACALAALLALALALACAAPSGEAPDEISHWTDCEGMPSDERRPPECWPPSRELSGAWD